MFFYSKKNHFDNPFDRFLFRKIIHMKPIFVQITNSNLKQTKLDQFIEKQNPSKYEMHPFSESSEVLN